MKHNKITEIHPYTYYIKHIPTGTQYYGVRWGNITKGICQFCKKHGISPSSARKCALGKQHTAKGWRFKLIRVED